MKEEINEEEVLKQIEESFCVAGYDVLESTILKEEPRKEA